MSPWAPLESLEKNSAKLEESLLNQRKQSTQQKCKINKSAKYFYFIPF